MPEMLRDGTGTSTLAKVGLDNRLNTRSLALSLQHIISDDNQRAFQAIGTATLASGTVTALHLKNEHTSFKMVVTYIRHQIIGASGGTSFPNVSNFFKLSLGRTYVSGGTSVSSVNVFGGSPNTSEVTIFNDSPTLAGTEREIDRWYTKADGDMNPLNKEGSLIIPPGETMELSYTGDHTSGIIYSRISFVMENGS